MQLRDYQIEAVRSVLSELAQHRSTLLVCATGGGKTVMFGEIAKEYLGRGERVLVLAHMRELLDQAYDKFRRLGVSVGRMGFEVAEKRIGRHIPDVVFASKDSLHKKRLDKYPEDAFGLIIHDEADYATKGTWNIINRFPLAKVVGVTATPKRTDGLKLLNFYQSIADVIEIIDLISWGYLVPIEQRYIPESSIRLEDVRVTGSGDFDDDELDRQMREERALIALAGVTVRESGDRPTLVFCTSVGHAEEVAEVINRHSPGKAAAVSGSDNAEDRRYKLERFRKRDIQYLCNCYVLTRGVDLPLVSHIVMGRPTKSLALYTQMLGRGTRPDGATLEESIRNGKANLQVTDLVGVSGEHKLITAIDVLSAGDDGVRETARRIIEKTGGGDTREIIEEAEREIAQAKRAALVAGKIDYASKVVDPFGVVGIYARSHGFGVRPTQSDIEALRKYGFSDNEISILDKQQAKILINERTHALRSGMASYRQLKKLRQYGLYPNITFDAAKNVMQVIAGNGWKIHGVEEEVNSIIQNDIASAELPF